MKIFMTMILAMVVLSGCSVEEVKTAVVDNQKVWSEYTNSTNVKYEDNKGITQDVNAISLDDIGFNIVGIDRLIADNLISADQYKEVWLGFGNDTDPYYANVRDGKDVVAGSVKVKDYINSGSDFKIDFQEILATPGNENVKIGDQIFQIDIYSDPNHKFLIETFSFIL